MKISDSYELDRDRQQWILTEWIITQDKDGNDRLKPTKTFHSTLQQVANYIVDGVDKLYINIDDYIERAETIKWEMAEILKEMKEAK